MLSLQIRFDQKTVLSTIKSMFALGVLSLSMTAIAQTSPAAPLAPESPQNILAPAASYDEILKTFEREAHAAYAIAKEKCQAVTDSTERDACLAKARLQFNADMRYAQKRAEMGY